jgi:hypothetical protein
MDTHRHLIKLYLQLRKDTGQDIGDDIVNLREGRAIREVIQWQLQDQGVDWIK